MRKLNFALIGIGGFGKNYARLLQSLPGIRLKTVVDTSPTSLKSRTDLLPKKAILSTNPKTALKDPEINCVVIATPTKTHFELAKLALESGKHVLVEKPMTRNLGEAKRLRQFVNTGDRVFMVGYQYLYNDYIHFLKKLIERGSFGRIYGVISDHMQSPVRQDVDIFTDASPHPLSIIKYLLNPGNPIRAIGVSKQDFASVNVRFKTGLITHIFASAYGPEKIRRLTFIGEKMIAVLDETKENKKLTLCRKQDDKIIIPDIQAGESLKNEVGAFINCVRGKKAPLTDVVFGYAITGFMEIIKKFILKKPS